MNKEVRVYSNTSPLKNADPEEDFDLSLYLHKAINKVKAHPRILIKPFIGLIIIIIFYSTLLFLFEKANVTPEQIIDFVNRFGVFTILALFIVQVIVDFSPFPHTPFALACNIILGPILGSLIVFLSAYITSLTNFVTARRIGRNYILSKYPQTASLMDKFSHKYSFEATIFFRNFSFVSFDIVSYVSALTKMKFFQFAFYTAIAQIPIILNSTIISIGLRTRNYALIIVSWIIVLFVAFSLIFIVRKIRKLR